MRFRTVTLLTFLCCGLTLPSSGQIVSRTLRVILPLPAGSTAFTTAKTYAPLWEKELGVTVIVEPKPGAQGTIAMMELAKAKPDGSTVGWVFKTMLYKNDKYDPRQFAYSTSLSQDEMYLVVSADSGITSLKELVALKPYLFGAVSLGARIAGAQFVQATGMGSQLYPSTPATARQDITAGRVGFAFLFNVDTRIGVQEEHSLRALATISPKRSTFFPDVPTIAEAMRSAGLPPYEVTPAFSAAAFPPGTPEAVVRRFSEATCKAAADQALIAKMTNIGATATCNTPQEMSDLVQRIYDESLQ